MILDPTVDYSIDPSTEIQIVSGDYRIKITNNGDGSSEITAYLISDELGRAHHSMHIENKTAN